MHHTKRGGTSVGLGRIPLEKDKRKVVKFIDLFAGMGGLRLGFEQAFNDIGFETSCVMTSEIKKYAVKALKENFKHERIVGDITKVVNEEIPNFDFLLASFPCQPFSSAGKGHGFLDTRGTLFFEIERILKNKKPYGFILENVSGLICHDKENKTDEIGRTFLAILNTLRKLEYKVSWSLINSKDFGVAQSRNRVYIVGTLDKEISLGNFEKRTATFGDIMEHGLDTLNTKFTDLLFRYCSSEELYGKNIEDRRGGENSIHSWDICLKGEISYEQKELLQLLIKERRRKRWSQEIGITYKDGIPLTKEQIKVFYNKPYLQEMLDDLVKKGYLVLEYPKDRVKIPIDNENFKVERKSDINKSVGYNIISGKLSFEFSKILDPNNVTPALVATDVLTLGVIDGNGVRNLTLREGLRLFGYPESYSLEFLNDNDKNRKKAFDLLGNTVVVPVIRAIANRLAKYYEIKI